VQGQTTETDESDSEETSQPLVCGGGEDSHSSILEWAKGLLDYFEQGSMLFFIKQKKYWCPICMSCSICNNHPQFKNWFYIGLELS
jgi:hypothetical protein